MSRTSIIRSAALALPLAAALVAGQAHSQTAAPMGNMMVTMTKKMVAMSASIQAAEKLCLGSTYDSERWEESKRKQWQHISQRTDKAVFDKADFDEAYDAAMQKTMNEWKTMTAAEQEAACNEMKAMAKKSKAAAAALMQGNQ